MRSSWRMMPHDLPPWRGVYDHFSTWRKSGKWDRINQGRRERSRTQRGRDPPSSVVSDHRPGLGPHPLSRTEAVGKADPGLDTRSGEALVDQLQPTSLFLLLYGDDMPRIPVGFHVLPRRWGSREHSQGWAPTEDWPSIARNCRKPARHSFTWR